MVLHGETGTYDLSGGVVVRRGAVVLRAQTATVEPDHRRGAGQRRRAAGRRHPRGPRRGVHAFLDGPFEASRRGRVLQGASRSSRSASPRWPRRAAAATVSPSRRTGSRARTRTTSRCTGPGSRSATAARARRRPGSWPPGRAVVDGDRVALSWPVFRVTPALPAHPAPGAGADPALALAAAHGAPDRVALPGGGNALRDGVGGGRCRSS